MISESLTAADATNVEWLRFMSAKVAWVELEVPYGVPGTPYRALVIINGRISEITDDLIGTGLKPLVLLDGQVRERVDTEGTPLILINGLFYTLPQGSTLLL